MDMRDHLLQLKLRRTGNVPVGRPASIAPSKSMLDAQLSQYRMASQTATHLTISGGATPTAASGPAIELF